MQYEREAEGDEFKDKESFVTQAYKDQMATAHREAEEEKKQEGERYSGLSGHANLWNRIAEKGFWLRGHGTLLPTASGGV